MFLPRVQSIPNWVGSMFKLWPAIWMSWSTGRAVSLYTLLPQARTVLSASSKTSPNMYTMFVTIKPNANEPMRRIKRWWFLTGCRRWWQHRPNICQRNKMHVMWACDVRLETQSLTELLTSHAPLAYQMVVPNIHTPIFTPVISRQMIRPNW